MAAVEEAAQGAQVLVRVDFRGFILGLADQLQEEGHRVQPEAVQAQLQPESH
ncbi:hypothetical protein SRABI128_02804 [Microbacterium sp. Bi128]|nr:hypothetical protein SRABI128_02804 [Microbacterium sp. Bi128]